MEDKSDALAERIVKKLFAGKPPDGYVRVNRGGTLVSEERRIKGKKARKQAKRARRDIIERARRQGHEVIVAPWR